MLAAVLQVFLEHRPEDALEQRNAPPCRAWLVACQRCRGPEILFAFFDSVSPNAPPPSGASLDAILRKFRSYGSFRIQRGDRVIIIAGDECPPPQPWSYSHKSNFLYLDRRRHAGDAPTIIPHQIARHVICEHARIIHEDPWRQRSQGYRVWNRVLESVWLPEATTLGPSSFSRCSNLAFLTLPSVESMGRHVFMDANAVRKVVVGPKFEGQHIPVAFIM